MTTYIFMENLEKKSALSGAMYELRFMKIFSFFISGTIFRLKGAIQAMSFLDCNGLLIAPESSGAWKDNSRDSKEDKNSKTSTRKSLSGYILNQNLSKI